MYESKTLIEEIVNLERNVNTGKIDHMENFRKDCCDSVCAATFVASKYAEQYSYDYGENLDVVLQINEKKDSTALKQFTVDFEKELMSTGNIFNKNKDEDKQTATTTKTNTEDDYLYLYGDNDIFVF